jgi:hypothetical protein
MPKCAVCPEEYESRERRDDHERWDHKDGEIHRAIKHLSRESSRLYDHLARKAKVRAEFAGVEAQTTTPSPTHTGDEHA